MSAMMMTHASSTKATFSRAGADACKLRSKVHRAPFMSGQPKQMRLVVSAQAHKVQVVFGLFRCMVTTWLLVVVS